MSEDSMPAFIKFKNLKESVMEALKKIFPLSFKRVDTASELTIGILIYVAMAIVVAIVIGIAGIFTIIPVFGSLICILLRIVGGAVDVYILAGVIIQILIFMKAIEK